MIPDAVEIAVAWRRLKGGMRNGGIVSHATKNRLVQEELSSAISASSIQEAQMQNSSRQGPTMAPILPHTIKQGAYPLPQMVPSQQLQTWLVACSEAVHATLSKGCLLINGNHLGKRFSARGVVGGVKLKGSLFLVPLKGAMSPACHLIGDLSPRTVVG